jgi:hypothetical protein
MHKDYKLGLVTEWIMTEDVDAFTLLTLFSIDF